MLVILNPHSGNQRAARVFASIRGALEAAGMHLELAPTQHAGHATELARDRDLDAVDCVLVVGGDGTWNEVLNGLMARGSGGAHLAAAGDAAASDPRPLPPLALVPGGTGNSIATSMGVTDPMAAIQPLLRGQLRRVDIGRVTMPHRLPQQPLYLCNLLGWGLGVDANVTAESCRCFGTWRYDCGAVWQIMRGARRQVRVVLDDEHVYEGDYCLIIVQNNAHGGSELRLAPFAKMDDGCLDVILAKNEGRAATIALFDELKRAGSHVYCDSVVYRRFKKMTVTCEEYAVALVRVFVELQKMF